MRRLSFLAFLFTALPLSALLGCPGFGETAQCPVLACDLQCDSLKQDRDGCSICECAAPAAPAVCWDNSECPTGSRCDTVNFCERAPNCVDGAPCPDACYGQCVAAAATCISDADCAAGQVCNSINNGGGANDRPAPPPTDPSGGSGGAPVVLPAPNGVCVDASCGTGDIALPECPPGSEAGFDAAKDACAATCIPVDRCRDLVPDLCTQTPGCQIVQEPCACAGGSNGSDPSGGAPAPCDCVAVERCVAVDDCAALDASTCEANPNCVLKPIGQGTTGSGGSDAPQCDPTDPSCSGGAPPPAPPPPPPPPDLVCVPRSADGSCLSDGDCLSGETCTLTTVCGSGCQANADGTSTCFDQCWSESGFCAPAQSCSDLTVDTCANDPSCAVVNGSCLPASTSCTADSDCAATQHCEVVESCPPCDPTNGGDLNCAAPCFVEGTCVDGAAPPINCVTDADCGGGSCIAVSVCDTCASQPPPPDGGTGTQPVPAPCDPQCRDENVCVFPAPPPSALCQSDADCTTTGQRCATETNACIQNPNDATNGCWFQCVDAASAGTYCLQDSQCGAGESCHFNGPVCLDDPGSDVAACSGWCAGVCANHVTPAKDPVTGECENIPDSCVPPGWQDVPACP